MTPMHFHIPVLPDVLQRPRLYRRMDDQSHCRIVLVTGQAAQGKSTMTADYLRRGQRPSLWFHLTAASSDSGVLFDMILRGLEPLSGTSRQSPSFPHTALGTRQDLPRQVEILVSALNRAASPVNLVLDDMEALAPGSPCLELIQSLLGESPRTVRFFLLSRTLPDLNLSRFKMNQELLELTNEDLAFTREEAMAYFSETPSGRTGNLDRDTVEKVFAATGGWAGGLVLVSEALRRSGSLEALPGQLSSEVFSYFSQEIYQYLNPEIRTFLRQTALFDELDTRILSQVFPDTDPVELLNRLEERNLFIQKSIPHAKWPVFRYNNLFREFLLDDLTRSLDSEGIDDLHRKIGQAFWEERDHEKAISFFMAARSHERVARILKIKGADYVITGRTDRLSRWIDALPEDLIQADPWLIFFRTMAVRIRGGKKNIRAFGRALDLFREQGEIRGILLSLAYLIEASVFIRQPSREILKTIRAGEEVLADLGGKYRFTWARTLLWQQIGLGYIAGAGEITRGISACRNAILLAQGIDNPGLVLNASVILTLGLVQSGDFAAARDMLEKTRAISQEDSQPEYRALEHITNIDLAMKRGDTALAGDLLMKSEADIEKFGLIFLYPGLVEARGLYHAGDGRPDQAIQAAEHLWDFSILEGNDFYQGISHRIKAVAFLLNKDPEQASVQARKAVSELERSRRGEVHIFQARQIYGTALYCLGRHREAGDELVPVLDYFRQIHWDLNFCETAFVLGLAALKSGGNSGREAASGYFTEGFEKAVENRYRHFPMLNDRLMADVLLGGWEMLGDPEPVLISHVRGSRAAVLEQLREALPGKKGPGGAERYAPLFRAACPRLMIRTLGPFSVVRGGHPLPAAALGGPKPLMLLKVLLLNGGRDVPKDVLMEALWPDAGESAGEKNLKINLHRLRKALEPFAVKAFGHIYLGQKGGRISLAADLVSVDTDTFISLARSGRRLESQGDPEGALASYQEAAALYRGDYFSDDPYMEGVVENREMYKRTCVDLLERAAVICREQNRWQEAAAALKRVLEIDTCHEAAYQELMAVYGGAGLKNEVIQIFSKCREALEKELDAEPDIRTRRLFDRLVKD